MTVTYAVNVSTYKDALGTSKLHIITTYTVMIHDLLAFRAPKTTPLGIPCATPPHVAS